jgi:hypothetical protein
MNHSEIIRYGRQIISKSFPLANKSYIISPGKQIILKSFDMAVIVVYLDDILIFTKKIKEHREVTRLVLKLLQEHKLFLKPDKCEFEKTKVEYLGVVVSHNSVEMDPVKVAGVTDWPALTNKKEVQSFLGFTNFYRR